MKVAFVDAVYPPVAQAAYDADPGLAERPWREQRDRLLETRFACWDSWSVACRDLGVDAEEMLVGCPQLDAAMKREGAAAEFADAAVVWRHLSPETSVLGAHGDRPGRVTVAMVSSEAPPDEFLAEFSLVVTAFPHYWVDLRERGLRHVEYLPLAFDPRRLGLREGDIDRRFMEGLPTSWEQRDIPASFVGGLGIDRHWRTGQHTISRCCEVVPEFKWWGYKGPDKITAQLQERYQDEAWGDGYYALLANTRVAVNRHGEVHRGTWRKPDGTRATTIWACNLRTFEAAGMGALLLTEDAPNLKHGGWEGWPEPLLVAWDECATYGNPNECAAQVRHYIDHPERAAEIAAAGQRAILDRHTYAHRAEVLLTWLSDLW